MAELKEVTPYIMIDRRDNLKQWINQGPHLICHESGDRVWMYATYSDELDPEIVPVGDGRTNGYDEEGNRIVSVPRHWCRFLTNDEYNDIIAFQEADVKLLGYAH